jgi:hypothetical protein
MVLSIDHEGRYGQELKTHLSCYLGLAARERIVEDR